MDIESTVIHAKHKLKGKWTVEIEHGVPLYVNDGRSLDDRKWTTDPQPLTDENLGNIQVLWKSNFIDHEWDVGTIDIDNLIVENDTHIGFIVYINGKWVVQSVTSKEALNQVNFH